MHISKVLSNLGAWNQLQTNYTGQYAEIQEAIEVLNPEQKPIKIHHSKEQSQMYDPRDISHALEKYLYGSGWVPEVLEEYKYANLQALKGDIGITWSFGKHAFNESDLFVKLPLFIKFGKIKLAILIVPMLHVRNMMATQPGSFENLKRRITAVTPLPLKYPFVILGIGDIPMKPEDVYELTSELDQFLIDSVGVSLLEMKIQTEKPAYDFKIQLPENHKIAKELCAFANHDRGGLILVGITDSGEQMGIPEIEVDAAQLRVIQVAQSNCDPPPEVDFEVFDIPHQQHRRVLVVRIHELKRKPCMVDNRIYIRRGSSAAPANPDEVRLLMSGRNAMMKIG